MDNSLKALQSNRARLAILTLAHFSVDFCGGLMIPLPEPTLVQHLGVSLPRVALLVGGGAIVINVVQPVSAWLLPARGMPIILAAAPAAAALITCIGLTHSYLLIGAMLLVAGIGIGMLHPEGALAAHCVAGEREGFGMSIFMSGGYFGYASGSLTSGVWVEHTNQNITHLWILAAPALLTTFLVLASGLHRLEGHVVAEEPSDPEGKFPFAPVFVLAACIALTLCTYVRFITVWLVRRFPGEAAQGWGGATVFAGGIAGAFGGIFWGHISDRWGRPQIIAFAQLLAMPFLYLVLRVQSPSMAPVWGVGFGLTLGAVFPLSVVLAQNSRGLGQRLRMGLGIGGAWGLGEVGFILGSRYIGRFPDTAHEPVHRILSLCGLGAALTAALCALLIWLQRKGCPPVEMAPE